MAGKLILCAGPIGNLRDAAPRLAEALAGADLVFAEDTRRAATLLASLGVDRPLRSYFVGNEEMRSKEVGERLRAGETIALLTDAGTPGVADPGLTAVRAAVAAGAEVTGIPGPSAVTLAVALSGLPGDRFVFEGFLPRKGAERRARIESLAVERRTAVLFCAPGRLAADLADLNDRLGGDRSAVVCRELTKLHEEVWRGGLSAAAAHWEGRRVRGEVTLVLGGATPPSPDEGDAVARAAALVAEGMSPSEASRIAARETGASRRKIYTALIELREGRPPASGG